MIFYEFRLCRRMIIPPLDYAPFQWRRSKIYRIGGLFNLIFWYGKIANQRTPKQKPECYCSTDETTYKVNTTKTQTTLRTARCSLVHVRKKFTQSRQAPVISILKQLTGPRIQIYEFTLMHIFVFSGVHREVFL